MTGITTGPAAGPPPPVGSNAEQHATLRKAAHQLEGVFLAQLFSAMRQTVPENGAFSGGSGESMYQSMRDDMLASSAAGKSTRGLGETLYRQLSRHLPPETTTSTGGTNAAGTNAGSTSAGVAAQAATVSAILPTIRG